MVGGLLGLPPPDPTGAHPAQRMRFGGWQYYDIDLLRRSRPVNGIALIMYMGIGDYLMATPFFEELRNLYPELPLHAYIPANSDAVNSRYVTQLAQNNPVFASVTTFAGSPRSSLRDYDVRDALRKIPKEHLPLRLLYDAEPDVCHRMTTLFESFGLKVRLPVSRPVVHKVPLSPNGAALLDSIRAAAGPEPAALVVCHFDTRSSGYVYPHCDAVMLGLIEAGYRILTLTPTSLENSALVPIDVTRLTPNDTIELLRELKKDGHRLAILSVNSLLWPISACLDIPNLGLHIFFDPAMHQYIYPNIRVVTHHVYKRVPPHQLVLVTESRDFVERPSRASPTVTDYAPGFVIEQFLAMMRDLDERKNPV